MIHVATVHWRDDTWIDVQLENLRRQIQEPFRTYAFLDGLGPEQAAKFDYATTEEVRSHPTKLNLLADLIGHAADGPDDLVVFIDGDAFPVGDFVSFAREHLPRHKLIAAQRYENNGDRQPHPCFCVTTIGFWQEIGGDWKPGHTWANLQGDAVTDVGGNLLGKLEDAGVDWLPLLRSNKHDLHPLLFAVYGDLAYHHGGGFRPSKGGRVARLAAGEAEIAKQPLSRLLDLLPERGAWKKLRWKIHPVYRLRARLREETAAQSRAFFERIQTDPDWLDALI